MTGFSETYARGALTGDDFLSCCVVLIGQTPGIGWGVVPSATGPMDGVVTYPLDSEMEDPGFVYVHFPLASFDDSDQAMAACAFTFGVDESDEFVWPDVGLVQRLVPVGLREALSAEVVAASVVPAPRRERLRGGGRGSGGGPLAEAPLTGAAGDCSF